MRASNCVVRTAKRVASVMVIALVALMEPAAGQVLAASPAARAAPAGAAVAPIGERAAVKPPGVRRFMLGTMRVQLPRVGAGRVKRAGAALGLEGRGRLVVHVVNAQGGAVAAASVHIRHPHRRLPQFNLTTGPAGVTAAGVGNGRWVVRAHRAGEGRGVARIVVRRGVPAVVTVTLHGMSASFHPHQQHLLGTRVPTLRSGTVAPKQKLGTTAPPPGAGSAPPVKIPPGGGAVHRPSPRNIAPKAE